MKFVVQNVLFLAAVTKFKCHLWQPIHKKFRKNSSISFKFETGDIWVA